MQAEFVPFTGNCRELQWGGNIASNWFMSIANQTQWRSQFGNTTQGLYIAAADGHAFGWKNLHGPGETLKFMDQALDDFAKRPPQHVDIQQDQLDAPFTHIPAKDTSVMRVFCRIRPLPEGASVHNRNLGRDNFWIYKPECQALLDSALDKPPGTAVPFPLPIAARLTRFHFVDNVRSIPDLWTAAEISKCAFTAQLENVDKLAETFTFSFHGDFEQQTANRKRGQTGSVDGLFTIDAQAATIVRFRAYAKATAWGHSTFAKQGALEGNFPLVYAIVDVSDSSSRIVPPYAISESKDYVAPALPPPPPAVVSNQLIKQDK